MEDIMYIIVIWCVVVITVSWYNKQNAKKSDSLKGQSEKLHAKESENAHDVKEIGDDAGEGVRAFESSAYHLVTHNTYEKVMEDRGLLGEYTVYKRLAFYEKDDARFLFNCYIPKQDEDEAELDVIMLHRSGIYVFESKNYSGGMLLGKEEEKKWTMALGKNKISIKSPVSQNKSHITWLRKLMDREDIPIYSVIVFSKYCNLDKVKVNGRGTIVCKWAEVAEKVAMCSARCPHCLDGEELDALYGMLYPYSQVTEEQKKKHVENILKYKEHSINGAACKENLQGRDIPEEEAIYDEVIHTVLRCLSHIRKGGGYGATVLIDVLCGRYKGDKEKEMNEIPEYGMLEDMRRDDLRRIIEWLIEYQYISVTEHSIYKTLNLTGKGRKEIAAADALEDVSGQPDSGCE